MNLIIRLIVLMGFINLMVEAKISTTIDLNSDNEVGYTKTDPNYEIPAIKYVPKPEYNLNKIVDGNINIWESRRDEVFVVAIAYPIGGEIFFINIGLLLPNNKVDKRYYIKHNNTWSRTTNRKYFESLRFIYRSLKFIDERIYGGDV